MIPVLIAAALVSLTGIPAIAVLAVGPAAIWAESGVWSLGMLFAGPLASLSL